MPSAYIARYATKSGRRYRVMYRLGGREAPPKHGGSFNLEREAKARRDWIAGELAAMRLPDLALTEPLPAETVAIVGPRWLSAAIDVGENTRITYRTSLGRIIPTLGRFPVDSITPADVQRLVDHLHATKRKRGTIKKTVVHLRLLLDFAGVTPNPARDRTVKLPYERRTEVDPPLASHLLAMRPRLTAKYRLPLLALDATGMRVGELEALTWADVDEFGKRWRVSAGVSKTKTARWVPVEQSVFDAVFSTVPRELRDDGARVFADFGADRFRTALAKACRAVGVPVFTPQDLRHRRATLWHLGNVPVVEAASWLGHSPEEHLKTYAHASLTDRMELPYAELLGRSEKLRHARLVQHG